jgi:hypothetical protein
MARREVPRYNRPVRDSWLELVDCVLRPARPDLDRCLRERERHLAHRQVIAEERTRALARCMAEIETARSAVFAAADGFVPSRMTELEREWRRLSRRDLDGETMELWARVAPASWIDRKRWRDSEPGRHVDAAIALAADVEGIEAAEAAIASLRVALAPWGVSIGPRARWRSCDDDFAETASLLAEPLVAAREALLARGAGTLVIERARGLEHDVHDAARVRLADRPVLAAALAHAAFVDALWRAASLGDRPNPVTSLRALWKTGYVLSAVGTSGVTLAIAPRDEDR